MFIIPSTLSSVFRTLFLYLARKPSIKSQTSEFRCDSKHRSRMVNKTVMSVDMECYKCKRIALKSFTEIDGIDSIAFNMKERTVTVMGDADPVCMANLLRRKFPCAQINSYGPPPQPPKPSKEGESKNGKGSDKKQQTGNSGIVEKTPYAVPYPIICYPPYGYHPSAYCAPPTHCCCGCSPCSCTSEIDVYVVKEEPPTCTIS